MMIFSFTSFEAGIRSGLDWVCGRCRTSLPHGIDLYQISAYPAILTASLPYAEQLSLSYPARLENLNDHILLSIYHFCIINRGNYKKYKQLNARLI